MRMRVSVVCAPHPRQEVEAALRAAGERLARKAESVSVKMDPAAPAVAILEFEMRRTAQYKVVDDIFRIVKLQTWDFYQDITVQFLSDEV